MSNKKIKYPILLGISALVLSGSSFVLAEKPFKSDRPIYLSQDTANSTQVETEIRQFIDDWGEAWSPEDNAPQYSRESLVPFYLQSEELLAFDFTDAESTTVYRGVENHHSTWEAFVRDYDYWTFTPVTESVQIYPQSANAAAATLLVDIYGRKPDATEFQANAHATLLLEKRDGNWVIVHENIWGPVNE